MAMLHEWTVMMMMMIIIIIIARICVAFIYLASVSLLICICL